MDRLDGQMDRRAGLGGPERRAVCRLQLKPLERAVCRHSLPQRPYAVEQVFELRGKGLQGGDGVGKCGRQVW